eukprot:IDg12693t1
MPIASALLISSLNYTGAFPSTLRCQHMYRALLLQGTQNPLSREKKNPAFSDTVAILAKSESTTTTTVPLITPAVSPTIIVLLAIPVSIIQANFLLAHPLRYTITAGWAARHRIKETSMMHAVASNASDATSRRSLDFDAPRTPAQSAARIANALRKERARPTCSANSQMS